MAFPIGEIYGLRRSALGVLQQCEHFTEDLGWIAAIDLLDDQNEWPIGLARRCVDRLHQNAIYERKPPVAGRPPPAYEVLIGERGMELNYAESGFGCLPILVSQRA
jgi:hypothetical protein